MAHDAGPDGMLLPLTGVDGPARRQLEGQASLVAFLSQPAAPKLTALQLKFRGYDTGLSPARVLAAPPPLHSVTDLSVEVQCHVQCVVTPGAVFPRDYKLMRALVMACAELQQLRIHALTSNQLYALTLDARLWRHMMHGCLPHTSLRRLELSAAPGNIVLKGDSGQQFPRWRDCRSSCFGAGLPRWTASCSL